MRWHFLIWAAFLGLGFSATIGLAQEKVEVPPGYEDAAPAAPRPVARAAQPMPARRPVARAAPPMLAPVAAWEAAPAMAAPAGQERSVLEVLSDALGEKADPNVRRLEIQFRPQFQQLLTPEMAFVRRVCEPDQEQLQEVVVGVRENLGAAVNEYAVAQNRIQKGRGNGATMLMPDPGVLLQKQVTAIVKAKLRPGQAQRYEEECAQRTARRRRAVVLNLVAKLDEDLGLTSDQREKLIESLTADYQASWGQWLQLLIHNAQVTPHIPEQCVLPVLNEAQKALWRQTPKTGYSNMGGIQFAPTAVVIKDAELEGLVNGQ